MASHVDKKVVLITGGTRGIGEACVKAFANEGYNIVFTYLSSKVKAAALQQKARDFGIETLAVHLDISKKQEIDKMISQALNRFGRIDVLVNNAGVSEIKKLEEINEVDWNKIMDANLKGAFFCSQTVFSHMKKRKTGRIINISSQAGLTGGFFIGAHYAISKAGIICLTKVFAKAGADFGILVNTISPGLARTDMINGFPSEIKKDLVGKIPLKRMAEPEEVASVAVFLASDKASYITGANIPVNGGMLML